jgi:predicted RNase H-like HicB family nuclease
MPNKYKFSLSWSDEDEGYIATCPEFTGLSAFGETAEEALAEAQVALKLFIESYETKGLTLPAPEKVRSHSGQIRLRLPKSLHAQAAGLAAADGVSLNDYLTLAVQHKVTAHHVGDRFVREMRKEIALTTSEKRMTLDLNLRSSTSVNPGDGNRRLETKKSGPSLVH